MKNKSKLDFCKQVIIEGGYLPKAFETKYKTTQMVETRQWFAWLCREKFGKQISLSEIARYLGNYNHATVIHSINTKKRQIELYQGEKKIADNLMRKAIAYYRLQQSDVMSIESKILSIEDHIKDDATMEGWRRLKLKENLNELKEAVYNAQHVLLEKET